MNKLILLLVLTTSTAFGQEVTSYTRKNYMIPMRDGVKLYTVVFSPANNKKPLPILIRRTPYSADFADTVVLASKFNGSSNMAKDGYIFVYQDVRGKYKSEGTMVIHQPIIHTTQKGAVDESTDTYDAIEWLIKNIPNNNGRAGIYGVSYPGWLALVGAVDPHPALKASSEQACMGDLFLGDDFHHNGAFRLSYGFEYTFGVEAAKGGSAFEFPQYDLYDWYLQLGSLKNVNAKYFHNKIPTWNNFVQHPNYDDFWKKDSPLSYVHYPEIPILHVGGYYDQEDINGPQLMYKHMEKKDSSNRNFIVLGPWNHGQWNAEEVTALGRISFEINTAEQFNALQKKWFDYWLKGIGDGKFDEAYCFQTGLNRWRSYKSWPPKETTIKRLYASVDNTCTFNKPSSSKGGLTYVSDPAKPVPYRSRPIEKTYSQGSRWGAWQVEDQRFVSSRPDVVNFVGDTLKEDLTVTGDIIAHLFASTTANDADFIVKLIDVYPNFNKKEISMSGYELPVAMEVFRGRFRKSFEKPEPLTPNKPEEFVIDLHQINHTFLKGHRLMIQVQSTWFPLIDRNPQKYVPNIFEANESDYVKATHTIYCNSQYATYVELPVAKE
ncbi:MAG TPA: CocE/NonD family hydrolase [Chryseolinea sp.]